MSTYLIKKHDYSPYFPADVCYHAYIVGNDGNETPLHKSDSNILQLAKDLHNLSDRDIYFDDDARVDFWNALPHTAGECAALWS